ncbi:MAG: thioredoxin family protein, partial [Erysipelotrichaceae bacterium]|nr:thioredoxin family protein [Erysipelotrichaceae bacterium]
GFWYYKGKNAVSTKRDDGTYDFSGISYHEINFKDLTPVKGYDPEGKGTDVEPRPKDSAIITLEDAGFLENSDGTFALLIYLPGCTSCASFKPVVEELAASGQLPVYEISFDLVKGLDDFADVRYTPSMFLYKEGRPVAFLDAGNKDDVPYYENVKNLSAWAAGYLDIEIIEGEAVNTDTGCDDSACTLG